MTRNRRLRLEWAEREGRDCLEVRGWTEAEARELEGLDAGELGRRLALYTGEAFAEGGDLRAVPPVAGSFTSVGAVVRFTPRFPFADGITYSLVVDTVGHGPEVWSIVCASQSLASDAEALAIYPTAAELPVNLLRIYIHFSAPMSEGWAARAIRVYRDDTGEPLEDVFLPPEPELWDPERRRLTMLLDPGRIKRGLVPNLEAGYPLVEGATIKVFVDAKFRDASGRPLRYGAERRCRIGPALRSRIDLNDWRITTPRAGSRTALVAEFGRPLDHGLLQHCLRVCDETGTVAPGDAEVGVEERSWRFTPSLPWRQGNYRLAVEPRLEDVAGNSPVRVFDRDITRPEDTPLTAGRLWIGFACS